MLKVIAAYIFLSMFSVFPVRAQTELPDEPGVYVVGSDGRANARENEFAISVPKALDLSKKRPLLVVLHGANNNGRNYIRDWASETGVTDMIVVAPSTVLMK